MRHQHDDDLPNIPRDTVIDPERVLLPAKFVYAALGVLISAGVWAGVQLFTLTAKVDAMAARMEAAWSRTEMREFSHALRSDNLDPSKPLTVPSPDEIHTRLNR